MQAGSSWKFIILLGWGRPKVEGRACISPSKMAAEDGDYYSVQDTQAN